MNVGPHATSTAMQSDPFVGFDIPPELEVNLQRHRAHLAQLITTLRSVGISEEEIEQSISVIVESYKAELIQTLKEMVR